MQRLLPHLRSSQVPVIWLNWGNRPDKLNLAPGVIRPFHRQGGPIPPILDKDSDDAEIIAGLIPEPADIHIDKYRLSGFWDTELDSVLRNLRVQTLLFEPASISTSASTRPCCWTRTASGYDCLLVEDCAATRSPTYCTEATLYGVEGGLRRDHRLGRTPRRPSRLGLSPPPSRTRPLMVMSVWSLTMGTKVFTPKSLRLK